MKITRKKLLEFINSRNKKTSLIINIFTKYLYKFIIDIYENSKTPKQFQKKLYEIPSWSHNEIDKEFIKFLKITLKQYNLIEDDLNELLKDIFILNIQILSKSNIDIEIKLTTFWYKLLKYTGKYFYENPTELEINEKENIKYIVKIIQNLIQKYIPIKDIFNIKKTHKIEYNFENVENDENINNIENENIENENIENDGKDDKSDSLKYINSEQFENEYYNPNNNININIIDENDDNLEKVIELPKKQQKNKKKLETIEIDEEFFK
jgi:hypothetical protein